MSHSASCESPRHRSGPIGFATDDEALQWIYEELREAHGLMMNGAELRKLLGFASDEAMRKAIERGSLNLPVFSLPGRTGWFVLTRDLAAWITTARRSGMDGG